ncbi:D-glycero-beta-D-manno-heptose 1,7-bisphosphate 7-phosphatase [secondary endosymbiont of Ctenarytaina eucalypti]|uniref:D,D-heptose 1,7-bisphosphate phosphatase n=1 Tax=secondary endosymbiont of Ctenarytaina eucalypti TaxID=1199245 RepID=J3TXT4_9ENTR|nr:D-glycero-beta-D-manno-heptose 1,7-bisphosphate 7-phosphatase [secondary endosymbiont of Ctenarytaina eucalypti]AFP85080.1 D,D-heptose 1,7-bisphosphate phosphatase [secondary endosymbiont of Ctenarytaina eucalypti]
MTRPVCAIFLDRDGTINADTGYVHEIDNFQFIDGVIKAMQELKKIGFALIVVTNQSGLARGLFSKKQFMRLTAYMKQSLAYFDVHLDAIYFCPHHPKAEVKLLRQECDCRKPKPGMLLKAQSYLHIDMAASYMVGDKLDDMLAGKAAGVGTRVLLCSKKALLVEHARAEADWVIDSLSSLPTEIKKRKIKHNASFIY